MRSILAGATAGAVEICTRPIAHTMRRAAADHEQPSHIPPSVCRMPFGTPSIPLGTRV